MERAKEIIVRGKREVNLRHCTDYFLADGEVNRYNNSEVLYLENRLRRYVKVDVWEEWNHIVNSNIEELKASHSFDELCEKLSNLKIKGIGSESIIATAAQLAYKYDDIVIDDSCWHVGFLQEASICKLIRVKCGLMPRDFCNTYIPHFDALSDKAKILAIVAFADLIRRYIVHSNI